MINSIFSERLSSLRREIESAGFDGFLVPMADEYQSEYVPPCARRVAFLSGFSGSAAYIVVLKDRAGFFTDGRYTLQAAQQVSGELFSLFNCAEKPPLAWLEENVGKGARIAYDPWLHPSEGIERLKKALAKVGADAAPVARNLVDVIWEDRPAAPLEPVVAHDLAYAGKSSADKRREIAEALKKKNLAAAVITDAASVAWLLNVRGRDVAHTPLPLSRAVVKDDASALWFVDARKVPDGLPAHLGDPVSILPPEDFPAALGNLARAGRGILLDPANAPSWIGDYLREVGGEIEKDKDPCALPRAIKNDVELAGMRAAHRRDGAALTKFLAWLDKHWEGGLTELEAEDKLAAFREADDKYRGPSFDTISGAGEHGAIVHYRATRESNARLMRGQLFLLDSGGQYLDGTTDVTRTVALGEPSAEMRDRFTRVLKGHIALASARFPDGTAGGDLDALTRQFLWAQGLDYGHGTGHGVGCYLGVHEGPQAISRRNKVPLKPGMVLSNEPGFYKAGHYGIRIENLQAVVEVAGLAGGERKTYGFETLTLAPLDRKLIEIGSLSRDEVKWIDAYHRRVREELQGMLDEETRGWLEEETRLIEK
ncbi:MAG: aminopeptidase P family protein [Alphaproteobacteria bacterium]|nr:aminopeptidase P family protein [Alphaproteobacteria bacterium]